MVKTQNSLVSLVKCDTYEYDTVHAKTVKAIDYLGGFASLIKPNDRVFIKLNCVGPFEASKHITTHPAIFKAVVCEVLKITNNIIVGDNPATKDIVYTLKKNGLFNICEEFNLQILNGKDSINIYNEHAKIHKEFEVSKEMIEADVLINMPKLKTHSLAYITCAEKNFFGFIYGLKKAGWHVKSNNPLQFGESINDLYGAVLKAYSNKTIINICDGIVGLEGEGPSTGGSPKQANAIIASLDAVSLDRVAVEVMGLDYNKSFINTIANERNLGVGSLDYISILGDSLNGFKDIVFEAPKDSLSILGLRLLKIKPLRNIVLEHPVINHDKCLRCGECVKICPPHTMQIKKGKFPRLQTTKCIRCWCCAEVCPANAISKSKRPIIGRIVFK